MRRRRHYGRRRHHVRRRHNPRRAGVTGGLMKAAVNGAYVIGGAVGSRWLTQMGLSMLGQSNSGIIGYGGNVVATLALAWAGGKFLGRGSRAWILAGGMAGLALRFLQDQTSFGQMFSLSGMGDMGMAAILPSSFVDPALFTGNGAQRRIPGAWQAPAPVKAVPAKAGMGWSTYGTSTYR